MIAMRFTIRLDNGLSFLLQCFAVIDRSRDENSSSWAVQAIVRPLPAPHRDLGSGTRSGRRVARSRVLNPVSSAMYVRPAR